MVMPPYHGATIRVPEAQIFEFYAGVVRRHRHPDHDPGRAGQPARVLSAAFLARMAREIEQLAYFKIETPGAASKLRELIRLGGDGDRRARGTARRRSRCWPTSTPAPPAR